MPSAGTGLHHGSRRGIGKEVEEPYASLGYSKKVLLVTLVPTLITTVLLGLFFTWSWVQNINQLLEDRGDSLSRQLAAAAEYGMFTANRSLLSSLSNALLEERDVRSITFYDARQERLLHTGPASTFDKSKISPECRYPLALGRQYGIHFPGVPAGPDAGEPAGP